MRSRSGSSTPRRSSRRRCSSTRRATPGTTAATSGQEADVHGLHRRDPGVSASDVTCSIQSCCAGLRLDRAVAVVAQVGEAVTDPLDVLLERGDEVRGGRRAARALDGEQVRETRRPGARGTSTGPRSPRVGSRHTVAAADVDAAERAGDRVEAGGVEDHVELEESLLGVDARRRDRPDRRPCGGRPA